MKAIIFGAGKIARSFIAHLLHNNDIEIVLVDANPDLVASLNVRGKYHVEVMGNSSRSAEIQNYTAYTLEQHEKIATAWSESQITFTSVGGKNLEALGQHLAQIIEIRMKSKDSDGVNNVITCENWKEPATLLRNAIANRLPQSHMRRFQAAYSFSEAVVMRSAIEPTPEQLKHDPLWVNAQDYWELPVDKSRIRGEPTPIEGIRYIEGFFGYLERKFYTYNAANGTVSFLGHARGHRYLYDAATDPWIIKILQGVYEETGKALSLKHNILYSAQEEFAKSSLKKLQDCHIIDYVERNARDPIRKLGPNDRLVGSARLAESFGIKPENLAVSIAAALHYFEPGDPSAVELRQLRESEGVEGVLTKVCKISPNEPLGILVMEAIKSLQQESILPA